MAMLFNIPTTLAHAVQAPAAFMPARRIGSVNPFGNQSALVESCAC